MAKLDSSVVITADHISQYLASSSDFVLELEVIDFARRNGFDVKHSGSYEDPITKKVRQFDIRPEIGYTRGPLAFAFAIECKAIQSYPLVVLRTPRLATKGGPPALPGRQ